MQPALSVIVFIQPLTKHRGIRVPNKQAVWQNDRILDKVNDWWTGRSSGRPISMEELYSGYYEWITRSERPTYGLNFDQFAKCLYAIGVLHLGGGEWRQAEEWEPKADQIRRVTGYVGI